MSQTEKAAYYQALKGAGVNFDRHYREYDTAELRAAYERLVDSQAETREPPPEPDPQMTLPGLDDDEPPPQEFFFPPPPQPAEPAAPPPASVANPREMAGERLNTQPEDTPIRVDEEGRQWFQEEIRKPAYPKPRGRRVLTYMDPGVEQQSIKVGDYVESFEVAGTGPARPAEVKITLPSYQVGVYKDPRFPFRVHTYNGAQGFDLFEVQDYYGGPELVPAEVKRIYVENVLCYDIRTTVRAIETEYRQLQLAGKIT
jgi:hypothetical protein